MRIAYPLAVPGMQGFFYLIYILTHFLSIDLCSLIGCSLMYLVAFAVNPYYLFDQIWILSDHLSAGQQAAASMISNTSPEATTDSPLPFIIYH